MAVQQERDLVVKEQWLSYYGEGLKQETTKSYRMSSFEKKNIMPPKVQAAIFGAMIVVGMLGAAMVAKEPLTIWMMGTSCLLLYSILNNGLSFFANDYKTYLIHSIYGFMFMLIAVIGIGTLCSGLSVFEAGGYRNILIIILIANFIFIAMIITIKGLISVIAEKDKRL
ncbi:hypothetical protein [Aureispira anguillae]|uniref:Uncharacterized protein n=1 Tax=Aureispira anguillae TaxID=2864201 RepID=A0A915YF54_9BACT|nr:hypothetical protein [Aureispira anguillae]BDS11987.1 hypothetical protein AsAng_0027020 [Aureispira anguillae]